MAAAESPAPTESIPVPATVKHVPAPLNQIAYATCYDVGRLRPHNEDALFALSSKLSSEDGLHNFGLFVVADGMGGHSLGERASGIAARTVGQVVLERLYLSVLKGADDDRPALQEAMASAVRTANREVNRAVPGGGTTLTAVLIFGRQLTLAHVGDSRAYLVQSDRLKPLTRDHSLVQHLIDLGQLSVEEAQMHPHKHVLVRAVGQKQDLEVDLTSTRLEAGSRVLLCSDGLWGMVSDDALLEIIHTSGTLQEACERMAKAANHAGGADNIAAVLCELPGLPSASALAAPLSPE